MLRLLIKYKYYFFFIVYISIIFIFFYSLKNFFKLENLNNLPYTEILNYININIKYSQLITLIFIFAFVWILMLGFISPILLLSGFLLNPYLAALTISLANACAGSILFYFSRIFFIKKISIFLPQKFYKVIDFINKDVLIYFFIFRVSGGFGVPSQLQNILPALTKINVIKYFIISFFGCLPIMYLTTSIGHSINYVTSNEIKFSIFKEPKIILFILIFIMIYFVTKFFKKKFFKES